MCSASSPRSSVFGEVDVISNALILDWEPTDSTGAPFAEAHISAERLPLLLHELTHCQCFQTAVGNAFRTLWDIAVAASKEPKVASEIERGIIPDRYRRLVQNLSAGLMLYQPWTEGLALFAEWDSLPGKAAAASKAMLNASNLLLKRHSYESFDKGYQTLGNAIRRARTGDLSERRKMDLLAFPLKGNNGFYLPGYFGGKSLNQ